MDKQRPKLFDIFYGNRGRRNCGISNILIYLLQLLQSGEIFWLVNISFIKKNNHRSIVWFRHQQVAIDKSGFEHRLPKRDNQQCLIEISSHEMHEMFSARALSEDIICGGQDPPNESGSRASSPH